MKNNFTTLHYSTLGILSKKPQSGYEVLNILKKTPLSKYSGSPGAIYPVLKKLEEENLVKSIIDQEKKLKPKKIYSLTQKGKKILSSWLKQPINRDEVQNNYDELILKFAFMVGILNEKDMVRFLKDFKDVITENLSLLKKYKQENSTDMFINNIDALDYGIKTNEASLIWAIKTLNSIES